MIKSRSEMRQRIYLPAGDARSSILERLTGTLRALSLAQPWLISIEPYKPLRSSNQNRYLWGIVYPTLLQSGRLDGWDAADIHEYFLGEHFGWERITGFGRSRLKPLRRSSRLNRQEFADFVDFIQRKCAEYGVYIPSPNEMEQAA